MTFAPRILLVTGGAGFIGASFVRHLLATDPRVRIVTLDALTYAGHRDNLADLPDPGRHELVEGSINDADLVRRLLRERAIDTVVNFAAESHVDRSIAGPAAFIRTNVEGTFALLEAVREVWCGEQGLAGAELAARRRFHHVSTDEVYGDLPVGAPAFTEQSPYAPRSPYAASKAAADHLVRAWTATWGLPCLVTACSNNYGPRQNAEKFIPVVIGSCLARRPIPVYGDGLQRRDWLHVDDHCRAIDVVLRQADPGSTWNVGGANERANLDLVLQICDLMDELVPAGTPYRNLVRHVPDRPGHDRRYAVDASRLRHELGWTPEVEFGAGLRETVLWYLARHR